MSKLSTFSYNVNLFNNNAEANKKVRNFKGFCHGEVE